jgi:hypothetical protein
MRKPRLRGEKFLAQGVTWTGFEDTQLCLAVTVLTTLLPSLTVYQSLVLPVLVSSHGHLGKNTLRAGEVLNIH